MPNIYIDVRDKVAKTREQPFIVCGNSDYKLLFDLGDEWNEYDAKTARLVFRRNGTMQHIDVLFDGNSVDVPVLYGCSEVLVGLYAGDIRTTTPARILCQPCITDGKPVHAQPEPDVYNQLMEYLAALQGGSRPIIGAPEPIVTGITFCHLGIPETTETDD